MKVLYLFLLFCVLTVHAQRRTSVKQDVESTTPKSPRGRGKARFTLTPEFSEISSTAKSAESSRRGPSRTRTNNAQATKPKPTPARTRSYEVEEIVNESPIDSFRRTSKPRVLTETAFVAANAGGRSSLFQPAVPAAEQIPVEDILQTFGSTARAIVAKNAALSGSPRPPLTRAEVVNPRSSFAGSRNEISSTRNGGLSKTEPRREGRRRSEPTTTSRSSSRAESSNGKTSTTPQRSEVPRTVVGARTIPITRIESRPTQSPVPSTRLETTSPTPFTRAEIATLPSESAQSIEELDVSAEIDETTLKASSELPSFENDIKREPLRVNTPLDTPSQPSSSPRRTVVKRINTRPRGEEESSSIRSRSRSRGSRRQTEDTLATSQTRNVPRTSRKRPDEARSRGPSVFNTGETLEARSRAERRIGGSAPERITLDLTASTSRDRGVRARAPTTTTARSESKVRATSRFNTRETTTSKSRTRSRNLPPVIDEQKLEVLPLFASEARTVKPTKKVNRGRARSFNSAEDVVQISATENNVKFIPRPIEINTKISFTRSESVESTTKPARTRKPIIKESVVAEVNEVTSKRTVGRKKSDIEGGAITRVKVDKPKVTVSQVVTSSRGRKKSAKTAVDKPKSSEEEIDEGDNYPEQFKALIQAKKQKKESRPTQPRLPLAKTTESTSTSTAAITSTATVAVLRDDNENELVPKPNPTSALPTSRSRKRTTTTQSPKLNSTTSRRQLSRPSSEIVTKPTRKSSRSSSTTTATTVPPKSSPSLSTSHRFHAKFTTKNDASATPKPTRSFSSKPATRGVYSSKKKEVESEEKKPRTAKKPTDESRQISKSSIKSRYSSRYRSDISQRVGGSRSTTSAPFYTPTVPTVVYSSTAPSKSSRRTTVNGGKDKDLGLEVISFDDPVNAIPSANLVNGELLTTDKALKVSSSVKERSTEKPLSIIESIERIINSVTAISSTAVPNVTTLTTTTTTTTTTTEAPTKSSAILKLATKKSTKDKTNPDKTQTANPLSITSEKPTTIIEKILSSLNAIQNDVSNQVGRDFNTVSSPSTTPLVPQVTKKYSSKYSSSKLSLAAPPSTSINPLSIFNEISEEQIKEKRTIGKLLTILNGLTTTVPPEELVVVTPKNFVTSQQSLPLSLSLSTTAAQTSTQPISTTPLTVSATTLFTPASLDTSSEKVPASILFTPANEPVASTSSEAPLFTSATSEISNPSPAPSTNVPSTTTSSTTLSTIQTQTPTVFTTAPVPSTTQSDEGRATSQAAASTVSQEQQTITTEASTGTGPTEATSTKAASSNEIDPNPLSAITGGTSVLPESSTPTTNTPSDRVTTDASSTAFTIFPTTIPTITNFEVSPGSVSIFSANDISNFITPEDHLYNTVTISGRANFDSAATTDSTTTEINSSTSSSSSSSSTENASSSTESASSSTESASTITASTESSTISPDFASSTSTTEVSTTESGTEAPPSTTISTNTTSANRANSTQLSNRSGRLLNIVQEPVSNNIDSVTPSTTTSTTPDYFIFAVLNNNTILRKRPPTVPNRQTPFLIVGVYPNNTVVKKYPNGTLVPMEQIIRVRGFDTRENPPPLPEITSNQVTEGGPQSPQTVEQNRMPQVNPLSIDSNSTTASPPASSSTTPSSSTSSALTSTTAPVPSSTTPSTTTAKPLTTTVASTTTSSTTAGTTTTAPISSTSTAVLPTLSELLNGRTVEAFNSLIKSNTQTSTNPTTTTTTNAPVQSSSPNYKTLTTNQITTSPGSTSTPDVTSTITPFTSAVETTTPAVATTTTLFTSPQKTVTTISAPTSVSINNRIVDTATMTSTTQKTRYTTTPTTTVKSTPSPKITTVVPTFFPSPTLLPTFISTLFPNLFTVTPVTPTTTPKSVTTTVPPKISERDNLILSASTVQPTTAAPTTTTVTTTRRTTTTTTTPRRTTTTATTTTTTTTTTPRPTTTRPRRTTTITTTPAPTTTGRPTTTPPPTTIRPPTTTSATASPTTTKKLKELTADQRKNLEAIAQLEKQQADLLKQLSFLTNLNFAGINNRPNKPPNVETTTYNSLANRVIAIAMEREQSRSTTKAPPKSIQDQIAAIEATLAPKTSEPDLKEVLKQYNVSGVDVTPSTTFGKSQDAILASILKEQGIGPSTPKSLEGIFQETTTTKKPKPRARPPPPPPSGPLRQGLNWLLNALAPPTTTRRPTSKPKTKKPAVEQEILTNQPTKITPVVTAAPKPTNKILSQNEIKDLIKQLEAAQRDPKKADELDFSKIKSLQNLIQGTQGVEVSSAGQNGASSRSPQIKLSSTVKPTTALPATVSNSIDDDDDEEDHIKPSTTTTKARPSLPPVRLRPVAGVDDTNDPFIRSNLVTAAVNVTRAISGFLGTALQDAASQVSNMFSNGSDNVRKLISGYSNVDPRSPPR